VSPYPGFPWKEAVKWVCLFVVVVIIIIIICIVATNSLSVYVIVVCIWLCCRSLTLLLSTCDNATRRQWQHSWIGWLYLCLHLLPFVVTAFTSLTFATFGWVYVHQAPIQNKCNDSHTHPFNGPFSGTTRVSRYQKGKTNLDFTEARDSEWQWHQLGHM